MLDKGATMDNKNSAKKFTKEQLIENLQKVATSLGHTPTIKEFNVHPDRICSSSTFTYKGYFKSWTKALQAAGLKPVRTRGITKEDLIKLLHDITKQLGYVPSMYKFLKTQNLFAHSNKHMFKKRFGSYPNLLKAAGLKREKKCFTIHYVTDPHYRSMQIMAYTAEHAKHTWVTKRRKGTIQYIETENGTKETC